MNKCMEECYQLLQQEHAHDIIMVGQHYPDGRANQMQGPCISIITAWEWLAERDSIIVSGEWPIQKRAIELRLSYKQSIKHVSCYC
jgi:hypothetical protein